MKKEYIMLIDIPICLFALKTSQQYVIDLNQCDTNCHDDVTDHPRAIIYLAVVKSVPESRRNKQKPLISNSTPQTSFPLPLSPPKTETATAIGMNQVATDENLF